MQYKIPVGNIKEYNLSVLKEELEATGVEVEGLYLGSGILIIDIPTSLTKGNKLTLKNIILTHTPLQFTWTMANKLHKRLVRTAEDIDKITAMRIRELMTREEGDPIEAQLKFLTRLIEGLYIDIGTATSLANFKARTKARISPYLATLAERDQIIKEGKSFKTTHSL